MAAQWRADKSESGFDAAHGNSLPNPPSVH
jgi:hypothetical protein